MYNPPPPVPYCPKLQQAIEQEQKKWDTEKEEIQRQHELEKEQGQQAVERAKEEAKREQRNVLSQQKQIMQLQRVSSDGDREWAVMVMLPW